MNNYVSYTDKIADEILQKEIAEEEWERFIKEKYDKKGLTLIGVRREKRITALRMTNNVVNEFYTVLIVSFCILSGVVTYLLCDKVLHYGSVLKVFLPLIVLFTMSAFFSSVITTMKDKNTIYNICNENLLSIEEKLQEEYTRVEIRKIIDEDYMVDNTLDLNGDKSENEEVIEDGQEVEEVEEKEIEVSID